MATTFCEIVQNLTDGTIKAAATYTATGQYTSSVMADLKDDDDRADVIATFENNGFALNGSAIVGYSGAKWGAWSNQVSDENGALSTPLIITGTFAALQSSTGISISFMDGFEAGEVTATWYNGTTVIDTVTETIASRVYFIDNSVSNFNKIILSFASTKNANTRIKLCEIDYGQVLVWSKNNLLNANALEEVDLAGAELTIGTLDFTVYDENQGFNMLNPLGIYAYLQQKQVLNVRESVGGVMRKMGKYYLDTWENTSATIAKFAAVDIFGLFDSVEYVTSSMWVGTAASTVFANIFAAASFTAYTVDSTIAAKLVYGYIPIVTVKEALHQLCIALNAACYVDRLGVVTIKELPTSVTANEITASQIMGKPTLKQSSLTNSVAVTAYSFTLATSATIYTESLAIGAYAVRFDNPCTTLSITGATITASGINYANITVATAGTVTITGRKYQPQTKTYTYEESGLTAATRSQAKVDKVYLISSNNAASVAQFIYTDYQRRITQSFRFVIEDERIGDNIDAYTILGANKTGTITKLDIDLTGGFIANAEAR